MGVALITGSAGLIGSEAARFFAAEGLEVVGIDNDLRSYFFGADASTDWQRQRLERELGGRYRHVDADIRDEAAIDELFRRYGSTIELVVHAAAQPSHDWAARDPKTDFGVNAQGTLNVLEATRRFCPDAVFIFTSTNKVYGEHPNALPLVEQETRLEIEPGHTYAEGIREDMPLDQTLHSLFGASKLAADILVQEYGRYFGLRSACFRCGCLTGPNHSGTRMHGFLGYLLKCTVQGEPYTIFGYQGKQVRDNIHSADLVRAFAEFFRAPCAGEVYNMGGGRFSNCSLREAIALAEQAAGRPLDYRYSTEHRTGDHKWWISDVSKFSAQYAGWRLEYNVAGIIDEIYRANAERWRDEIRRAGSPAKGGAPTP